MGVNGYALWYSVPSSSYHKFYDGGTKTSTLDSSGNLTNTGTITNGSSSYIYAGGLRIGGFDGNTLYQSGNIGISPNNSKFRKHN